MGVLRTKPIGENTGVRSELHKCLTAVDLTLIGIGATIGAGIFVLTGVAAATTAGPGVMMSFAIAGFVCLFAALSYAELSSAIGGSGSAYGYAYVGLGELAAWIVGWDLILEYAVGACAIAIGWSGYLVDTLKTMGITIPKSLTHCYFEGGVVNLFAMLIILILSVILMLGVKQSAKFNRWIVGVKLIVIGLFILAAFVNVEPTHWEPFAPFGWMGIIQGAAFVFFAFLGFDAVSTAAEEAINPQRDLSIGTIASLVVSTLIYIVVAGLLTGIASYTSLNVNSPVADSLYRLGYHVVPNIIAVGAVIGITSGTMILMYGLTRIFYSMSKDGLLPIEFSQVSKKTQTPMQLIAFTGVVLATIAGFFPLKEIAELVNIGTLAAFAIVCFVTLCMRYTMPNLQRPFKTPLCPYIPALGVLACVYLMTTLPLQTWIRFGVWMGIGLIVYMLYGYKNSRLNVRVV